MNTFGFIGCGNMGGTLAAAVAKAAKDSIAIADNDGAKTEKLAKTAGGKVMTNSGIAKECRYIFLGVKPQVLPSLMGEIAPVLRKREDRYVLVSMAAGVSVETVAGFVGEGCPVIRIMPNTPAAVGAGIILHCENSAVTAEEIAELEKALSFAGEVSPISEGLIDAASAITGCGPAFVYMFIEALADGGVKCGLPRDKAAAFAAEAVYGSAKMVLESGQHTAQLKDAVCSPAGTTIAGVEALEKAAFRAAAMEAVSAAYTRTKELAKK